MTSFAKFEFDKPLESHFCVQPRKTIFKHVCGPNAHFFDPGEIDLKQNFFYSTLLCMGSMSTKDRIWQNRNKG